MIILEFSEPNTTETVSVEAETDTIKSTPAPVSRSKDNPVDSTSALESYGGYSIVIILTVIGFVLIFVGSWIIYKRMFVRKSITTKDTKNINIHDNVTVYENRQIIEHVDEDNNRKSMNNPVVGLVEYLRDSGHSLDITDNDILNHMQLAHLSDNEGNKEHIGKRNNKISLAIADEDEDDIVITVTIKTPKRSEDWRLKMKNGDKENSDSIEDMYGDITDNEAPIGRTPTMGDDGNEREIAKNEDMNEDMKITPNTKVHLPALRTKRQWI